MQVVSLLKDKKLSTTPSFHENCIIVISFNKAVQSWIWFPLNLTFLTYKIRYYFDEKLMILCTLIQIVNVIYRSRNKNYLNLTMYTVHCICVHMPKGGTSWIKN